MKDRTGIVHTVCWNIPYVLREVLYVWKLFKGESRGDIGDLFYDEKVLFLSLNCQKWDTYPWKIIKFISQKDLSDFILSKIFMLLIFWNTRMLLDSLLFLPDKLSGQSIIINLTKIIRLSVYRIRRKKIISTIGMWLSCPSWKLSHIHVSRRRKKQNHQ